MAPHYSWDLEVQCDDEKKAKRFAECLAKLLQHPPDLKGCFVSYFVNELSFEYTPVYVFFFSALPSPAGCVCSCFSCSLFKNRECKPDFSVLKTFLVHMLVTLVLASGKTN